MNLYQEIAMRIVEDIQSGQIPEKLPPWRTMEARYGVSRGSIEKACNMLRSMGVIAHKGNRRAYHYCPREVRKGASRFGILSATPPFDHFLTEFYEKSVYAVQKLLGPGHTAVTEYVGQDPAAEEAALRRFLQMGLDGIFAFPLMRHQRLINLEAYREFEIRSTRLVFLYRNVREIRAPSVYYDPRGLIETFVSRLAELGCEIFLDFGKTSRHFSGDQHEAFRLLFEDNARYFTVRLPPDLPEELEATVDCFARIIEELNLPKTKKLGMIVANDAHLHMTDLALQKLGWTNYEILTDGLMRGLGLDTYKIDPRAINPRFFKGPKLDYRAREIGEVATRMMQSQLNGKFSYSYSMPLMPRWE